MKFSEKDGYDTGSNLEHFRDVTVKPLNPGSIYLFPGSVFVCNIMEKRVNRFSWKFYETSDMTQEITRWVDGTPTTEVTQVTIW